MGGYRINSTSGELTYNPPGYTGTDSFSFQVMDIHNATSNIARVSIIINPAPEESTIPSPSEQQPSLTEQTPSQGPMTFWFHLTNKHFLDNVAIKAIGENGGTVEYRTRLFFSSDFDKQADAGVFKVGQKVTACFMVMM